MPEGMTPEQLLAWKRQQQRSKFVAKIAAEQQKAAASRRGHVNQVGGLYGVIRPTR